LCRIVVHPQCTLQNSLSLNSINFRVVELWNEHLDRHPKHPGSGLLATRNNAWLQSQRASFVPSCSVRCKSSLQVEPTPEFRVAILLNDGKVGGILPVSTLSSCLFRVLPTILCPRIQGDSLLSCIALCFHTAFGFLTLLFAHNARCRIVVRA